MVAHDVGNTLTILTRELLRQQIGVQYDGNSAAPSVNTAFIPNSDDFVRDAQIKQLGRENKKGRVGEGEGRGAAGKVRRNCGEQENPPEGNCANSVSFSRSWGFLASPPISWGKQIWGGTGIKERG
jgi:hypothetical protein